MPSVARRKLLRPRTMLAIAAFLCALAPAPASAATPLHGVQLHSLWSNVSNADMDRELDLAHQVGSNVVRVDVGWSSLETLGKGQYSDWYVTKLDRFVTGADARGMKVVASMLSTPCWASSAPSSLKQNCAGTWWDRGVTWYPPTDPDDYGDAARWLTARYGTKLAALEVWNEPAITSNRFWISPDPAAAYAALLRAAYPGAKAGNAQVPVLATLDGTDPAFLGAIYDDGARGSYDGLAAHPYGDRDLSGLKALHDLQVRKGDSAPIWVTEFGWHTGTSQNSVNSDTQADRILEQFNGLAALSWVHSAITYELRDEGTDASYQEDNWGLVKRDFSPKPSLAALTTAMGGGGPGGDPAKDTTPPAAPTGLVADPAGTAMALDWHPSPEPDLAGYRVYRKKHDGTWTRVATAPNDAVLVGTLKVGRTYRFRVTAFDAAGNESAPSSKVRTLLAP
jgi:hypothetical protein